MTSVRPTMSDTFSISPRVQEFALDLRKAFPRSPRSKLGPYVIAARTLDKCRATLLGWNGEYNFDCLLDNYFFGFAEIEADDFKTAVADGASDDDMAAWVVEHAKGRESEAIIGWNNRMRELRLSELPSRAQAFMEEYVPKFVPAGRVPHCWFDVYDMEEGRL